MTKLSTDILDGKYPAKNHARSVLTNLQSLIASKSSPTFNLEKTSIYLKGDTLVYYPYCDQTAPFRQDRYFFYLSGSNIPDSHILYDIGTDKLTLFLPPIDPDDVVWSGLPLSLEEAKEKYDVDEVKYSNDLTASITDGTNVIGIQSHKGITTANLGKDVNDILLEALDEARMIKDDYEIALIKKANDISYKAHLECMAKTLTLNKKNETEVHGEFIYHCICQGAKSQAYDSICGSGHNCSTLHYVKNDESLENRQLILIDAGAEWENYASDVTRTFPINGEWTPEAKTIYNIVLDMNKQTMDGVKEGVLWDDLHLLAHKILIEDFLKLGIFKSEFSADKILESRVSAIFLPHGLGHMLGMNTHDTGGRANYDDPDVLFRYLRIRRTLLAGMVVTIEPGIYFSKFVLDHFLEDKEKDYGQYIDFDILKKYWDVGGVRLEDDVVVLKDGFVNLTEVPKDADEVARIVREGTY